jgi:hypothetical protein
MLRDRVSHVCAGLEWLVSLLIGTGVIPLSLLIRFISRNFFGINVPTVCSSTGSALQLCQCLCAHIITVYFTPFIGCLESQVPRFCAQTVSDKELLLVTLIAFSGFVLLGTKAYESS